MSNVFVVDTYQKPLDPVHPGRARMLLSQGKAAVWRRFPFTIILFKAVEHPQVQPLRLKIDPGSQTTGIALVNDASGEVVFAAELAHRGEQITKNLATRRAVRRNRRARKTRYRQARFQNRRRPAGWLAPSLQSRVDNILTWIRRIVRVCPIEAISMELVKFDMQLMENAEIGGVEYQQGKLQGYETREYLLQRWDHQCAYCNKKNTPLQIEHIHPRAKGGTNRISNLTLACEPCNIAKGTQDIAVFLRSKPDILKRIQTQAKMPLRDAAAVNSTRWTLYARLKAMDLPVEVGSGGLTKYNRSQRALPKAHWLDASCVGKSTPDVLRVEKVVPLLITATGHGCRRMRNVNNIGFPCSKPKGAKKIKCFQTGDIARAIVTTGKKQGTYTGRVIVRSTGSFDLTTKIGKVGGLSVRFFTHLHKSDGYSYAKGSGHSSPA
jgi:hypothetical protein